jgi:hypothetical protein
MRQSRDRPNCNCSAGDQRYADQDGMGSALFSWRDHSACRSRPGDSGRLCGRRGRRA